MCDWLPLTHRMAALRSMDSVAQPLAEQEVKLILACIQMYIWLECKRRSLSVMLVDMLVAHDELRMAEPFSFVRVTSNARALA